MISYAEFVTVVEVIWTTLAAVGIWLGLYLLRAEWQDRALTVAENGRTRILSWALVLNESLRVVSQLILFVIGVAALATPNPAAPATPLGPVLNLLIVLFTVIGVAQSGVLIYARQRIARYVPPPVVEAARQDTLIEVQHEVSETKKAAHAAYETADQVNVKIADLAKRATASEDRADISERRADAAEEREGE